MKLEDKTTFKKTLIKMRTEMITMRNELSSPAITCAEDGQDIKPKEIDWLTMQEAELSRMIEDLEKEGA